MATQRSWTEPNTSRSNTLTHLASHDSNNLNFSNSPVRTRIPVGVAGTQLTAAPIPINPICWIITRSMTVTAPRHAEFDDGEAHEGLVLDASVSTAAQSVFIAMARPDMQSVTPSESAPSPERHGRPDTRGCQLNRRVARQPAALRRAL